MTLRVGFVQPDGTTVRPAGDEIADQQYAFMLLSNCIGMPTLDRSTIDEFVRRVDLYQTYLGPVLHSGKDGTSVLLDRTYLMSLLPGGAWTNATKVSKRDYDASLAKERDAYWKSVDAKN